MMRNDFIAAWFACLLDATIRSLLLFALLGVLLYWLRHASAAVRHAALTLTLGSLLCLPLLPLILPRWEIPILPSVSAAAPDRASHAVRSRNATSSEGSPFVVTPAANESSAWPTVPPYVTGHHAAQTWSSPIISGLFWLWLLGVVLLLSRLLMGSVQVRQLAYRSYAVTEGSLRETANACSHAVGAKRSVALLQSLSEETPMVWGFFSPALLLPKSVAAWPHPRLRAALLHEYAHITRGDWLTQVLAYIVCALYWFHPLVWWAARRLRIESEFACDDLALRAGFRSSDYAAQILEVFRTMKANKNTESLAVPMVRHSELKERLQAVLETGRSRTPATRGLLLLLGSAMACALLMLAALRPGAQTQDTSETRLACQENLKKLGVALLMYAQDYDLKMPPMKAQQQVQPLLYPYLVPWKSRTKDPAQADPFFACPETKKSYQLNAVMGGKIVKRRYMPYPPVKNASQITLVRDAVPHEGEGARWNVLYADGHVAAVDKPNDEAGIKGNPEIHPKVFRFDKKKPPHSSGKKKAPVKR